MRTLAAKLMTYGLGRGPEPGDDAAIAAIAEAAAADGHRFSRLVVEIVRSEPFRSRAAEPAETEEQP